MRASLITSPGARLINTNKMRSSYSLNAGDRNRWAACGARENYVVTRGILNTGCTAFASSMRSAAGTLRQARKVKQPKIFRLFLFTQQL